MKVVSDIRRLYQRLRSESGETMVETLVSILITSLALLLLASAIGSSVRIVMSSRDSMGRYYRAESGMGGSGADASVTLDVPISNHGKTESITLYTDADTGISYYERRP